MPEQRWRAFVGVGFLTPETIDMLARSIEEQCEKERNTDDLKRIHKLIRENEAATANLIKALESGKAVDIISSQIEKRQQERTNLETQLAMEKIQRPSLQYDQVRFFFERFIKGDLNDIHYRQSLVDVFIGRIELFNDHMIIYYNSHDGQKTNIPVDEPEKVRLRGVVPLRYNSDKGGKPHGIRVCEEYPVVFLLFSQRKSRVKPHPWRGGVSLTTKMP